MLRVVLAFLFLFSCLELSAQEYSYSNYAGGGLSGATVYCSEQDKDGFLWFGTETGLTRFDGVNYKSFSTSDGLPDNEVLKLFVDSKNRVWILPFSNSLCYYYQGKIYNQHNDALLKKIVIRSRIKSIQEDKLGNILIQEDQASHIVRANGKITVLSKIDGRPFSALIAGKNSKGGFRVAVSQSTKRTVDITDLSKFKVVDRVVENELFTANSYLFSPQFDIVRTKDSIVIFPTLGKRYSIPVPGNVISLQSLNNSILIINTTSGSILFDVLKRKKIENLLPGHKVTSVLLDQENNFWLTTVGEGVFRLRSTKFFNVQFNIKGSSLSAYCLEKWKNAIYVGTENMMLWSYSTIDRTLKSEKLGMGSENSRVYSLVKLPSGQLAIGTDEGVFVSSQMKQQLLSYKLVVKQLRLKGDSLLIASGQGVMVYDFNNNFNKMVYDGRATSILPTNAGCLIGTLAGLYELRGEEITFLGTNEPRLKTRVADMAMLQDGTICMATYGNGLVGIKNNKVVFTITDQHGLSSNNCRNISIAGNTIWVGTNKGLNKITVAKEGFQITKIQKSDGLASDIINALLINGDTLYIGTPAGLTFFNQKDIVQQSPCLLKITSVSISGHTVGDLTKPLKLKSTDNNIHFEFAGISYRSEGDLYYKYRLIGLDTAWKTTRENFLSYPSLPAGKFELQLIAVNRFGSNSDLRQVSFEIEERLFDKLGVRVLLVILFLLVTFLIVKFYVRGIRRKEAEKSQMLQLVADFEQRALKAQMNPHFIFNSLNSIQQFVLDKDIVGANRFITNFSKLIRQTLNLSSQQEITLNEELEYLETYLKLERERSENKFDYRINLNGINIYDYSIPPMLLQPFVENSIRHGIGYRKDSNGLIRIEFKLNDDRLICEIEDNGVGRSVSSSFARNSVVKHESKGMALIEDRVKVLNKNSQKKIEYFLTDLTDENGVASGTRVTVIFYC